MDAKTKRRFWRKVWKTDNNGGCWLWEATTLDSGYGQFWLRGGMRRAHRVVFEIAGVTNGTVHPDLVVDHKCGERACVNPDHLGITTRSENQRQVHARKGDYPQYGDKEATP